MQSLHRKTLDRYLQRRQGRVDNHGAGTGAAILVDDPPHCDGIKAAAIRAIGREGVDAVGDGQDTRIGRELIASKSAMIPLTIEAFVVRADVTRNRTVEPLATPSASFTPVCPVQ